MSQHVSDCIHYWVLDSCDKGVCKKCGSIKDFSPPPERLTRLEKAETRKLNHDFYRQGRICLNILDVQ